MTDRASIERIVLEALSATEIQFSAKFQPNVVTRGAFGKILISKVKDLAQPHVEYTDDIADPISHHTLQEVCVQVVLYGSSEDANEAAGELAQKCVDVFTKTTVRDVMSAEGVSVMHTTSIQDVSMLIRDKYEERSWFELYLSTSRAVEETVDVIEHIEIASDSLNIPETTVDLVPAPTAVPIYIYLIVAAQSPQFQTSTKIADFQAIADVFFADFTDGQDFVYADWLEFINEHCTDVAGCNAMQTNPSGPQDQQNGTGVSTDASVLISPVTSVNNHEFNVSDVEIDTGSIAAGVVVFVDPTFD